MNVSSVSETLRPLGIDGDFRPCRAALWIAILCLLPLIALGLGVDFSTYRPLLSPESVAELSSAELGEAAHHSLRGSFSHTMLEWTAVCAAAFVVVLSFVHFRMTRESSLPIIGVALACAGAMDAFHTFAADRLIQGGIAENHELIPFTWALCRLFNGSILLIGVGIFAFSAPSLSSKRYGFIVAISLLFVSAAYFTIRACATSGSLPTTMFPDSLVKRPYDIYPLVPYLLCVVLVIPKYLKRHHTLFAYSLLWSMIPHIATQLYMAFGSLRLHDSCFNIAHGLKAVAYVVPVVGLLLEHMRIYSENKRSQTAVQESETRHRAVLDNLIDGLITIDDAGGIESVNPSALRLFGYEEGELLGRNVRMLMPEPHRSSHDGYLERYKSTETARIVGIGREIEGLRKDGSTFPMELSVSQMRLGDHRMFSGTIRDITDRREAEIALKSHAAALQEFSDEVELRNQELEVAKKALECAAIDLERSNNELDAFAYIASHDLKEPLRGIHNYATFLLEDYGDKFDAEGRAKLQTLPRLTQRLETFIDSLLHVSRVGRSDLAVAETDLNNPLAEVLDTLHIRLQECGVEVRVPRPLPRVVCDRVRIVEVFRNLISNAMKYNDKDEKWIEIGYADGRETDQADGAGRSAIVFYVRDNGIGIREKHLDAVFRIFKRLHGRDKYGGGTGAGMTIVKKIIERHDGRIWIESTLGVGTTFYFTLQETNDNDHDKHHRLPAHSAD